MVEACQEELLLFMVTNGICSPEFKDDDRGNQTVRNKDRWGAHWSRRGIPCFQLAAVIYIHLHLQARSKEKGSSALQKHCREEYNRH